MRRRKTRVKNNQKVVKELKSVETQEEKRVAPTPKELREQEETRVDIRTRILNRMKKRKETTNEELTKLEITPKEYFEEVKGKKQQVTEEYLKEYYEECLRYLSKYKKTNQVRAMKKLMYHIETVEAEVKLVKEGIDKYVMYEDILDYIDNVSKKVVKIIDVEDYERDIPDDIADKLEKYRGYFERVFVVYTDYTGKEEKKVKKAERDRDPIIFGAFVDTRQMVMVERFYYLGDWEDEYCDLTLEKMVNETKNKRGKDIEHKIDGEELLKEVRERMGKVTQSEGVKW